MSARGPHEAFLSALPADLREIAAGHPDLESRVARWVTDAQSAWPDLEMTDDAFVRHIAAHVDKSQPFETALEAVRAADLYVTAACASGSSAAIRAFERSYFRELEVLWPSYRNAASNIEDARQLLRAKLFVASADAAPKISEFSGRGNLRSWVRVVAARMLMDLGEKKDRDEPTPDDYFAELVAYDDHVLDTYKARYAAEFREAFSEALGSLSARERALLRHAYVRGSSVGEIGAIYAVHRATAARWVAAARDHLVQDVKQGLKARLALAPDELDSVLRLIESTAHITLEKLLAESKGA